ncbi:hypothetical protein ACJMK2_013406 [Sinanodonta woodiana]|uniref:ILCR1 Ig-like domain-containing protein n=1 Tax=Sinanodonta woodiana TaxID=1069815 RepID=A0ABD3V0K9_SINWO
MEVIVQTSCPEQRVGNSPDLFVGPWHVDGPSEVITEHFCKQDENANNMPGMRIRWKSPDHSGMRDLKGFEITIEGATEICIIVDLSHANITQDIFQYGELQFEQIIYPIEVGSLYIVTIHSLPKKITAKSRTHFSTSNSCKDASPATWIASLKIKKDFMNGTIFVTFDPPPLIYEFTSFTYQLKRQIGNNVSIETRRLNSTNCVFGNLTSTEKYQVTVQPYDPFWNDRIRCKCKNIAKVCDTCTWTRSGTFTFNNSIVRRNNVSELVNENITVKYDLKTDAIIISSVIPISVLIALIVFIVWKKGVIADKDSDTKKYICLVVNGERENYVCLLSSLQYLIQSTGRCITRVLDCSFSSVQMMVDVKNSDSIVLVTVPVYTKPVTNGVNYVETGQHFLESIQLAHEKSAKGKVFREKLVRITFYDIASGLNQYSCGRQFQLPNDLVPFLVDIGCLQTALTNDFELQRHMFMNTDFKMAFDDLIATCQTIISNNRVETTNTPSREQCECKLCIKDYQGKIELETSPLSCQHNKYSPKSDVVAGIYTQGIHRVGKDLSKNVTLSACHCKDRVQAFEDLKKTKSNDSPCNCPTHEIMLKSSLPLSYRNDTRVIRKKYDHDITAGDLGLPVASRKGELKQEHSAFPDGAVMETLLGQVKWDCENEEEDCVTNDITFPDSGYFECMSQVGAQFLGVSDINMVDMDDTDQDDVISRDMYLINRRYDYIIKQLNKGDAVSISGNSV